MKRWMGTFFVLGLLLSACTVPSASSGQDVNGGQQSAAPVSVTRALTSEPTSLNPYAAAGSGQNVILPFLFDTLLFRDADNSYQPYLAQTWDIEDGGKTITFHLNPAAKFQDGTPVDAEAVVFSFEYAKSQGPTAVVNSGLSDVEKIEALDAQTVRFTFKQPSATFFGTISTPYAGIVSPKAIEEEGDQFGQKPVGSGPYILDKWEPGVAITLKANPDYAWAPPVVKNQGAPSADQLVFKFIPDATSQFNAFQVGEVDILFVNQPSQIEKLRQDANTTLIETTLNSLVYLGFNMQKAPFDNLQVRQALSHAINKQELVDTALGGIGDPAYAPVSPSLFGFDESLKQYELGYDPEKSAALLQEAGYTRQDDGSWVNANGEKLAVKLLTSTRPPNEALAVVIQSQLQAIGVPVEIKQLESSAAMEAAASGDYDVMLWRYDWSDPDVLNIYLSSARIGRTNRQFYSNEQVDELLQKGAVEMDNAVRKDLYVQAQQRILQDAVWQPLYIPKDFIAIRSNLDGVIVGSMGRLLMNDVTLKK